jgi:hypothetical protein
MTAEGTTCLDWLTAAVEALLIGHEHEVAQEGMELGAPIWRSIARGETSNHFYGKFCMHTLQTEKVMSARISPNSKL